MKNKLCLLILILFSAGITIAENIDPQNTDNQFAYGENVGWINFEPGQTGSGVLVESDKVTGYIWGENIGWINLSPNTYGGVINDGLGHLSGFAWGENVGWINFDPDYGGVSIDINGNFSGYAWGENIGWVNFDSSELSGQGVEVCVVNYQDLATMAEQWLKSGRGWSADLYLDSNIDFQDFNILAIYWMDYCPDNWSLN
ncbi:MAG: hypothetical protein A2Y12_06000 [Planctomycetes bacterium GWF2_42_9]|nr:MAG: hypothetical protein A2Y12_06000 [Planctomycetes bacterium GWF2_42_9]HAL45787.1 hypothetical protein [Phycisphaerales bacterium]